MVYYAMRTALTGLGIVAIGLLTAAALVDRQRVEVPPVGPSVEQICVEAMQRAPADLSWAASNRAEKVRGREIKAVTLGELPGHTGSLVRVAGVLHAEFEWVALYPSRGAMEEQPWRSPWVRLTSLWPDEPYWRTKGPSISDRCVVVEGTYSGGAGGHFGKRARVDVLFPSRCQSVSAIAHPEPNAAASRIVRPLRLMTLGQLVRATS